MKRIILISILLVTFAFSSSVFAQGTGSTINWFVTACQNQAVLDFNGEMQAGYDIYYQVYKGFSTLGEQLTTQRRISVNDTYAVSEVVPYQNAMTLGFGEGVSIVLSMARENDPESTIFEETLVEFVSTCVEPGNSLVNSTGQGDVAQAGSLISSAEIFTPTGELLNPVFAAAPEAIVQLGARPSDQRIPGRTNNAGLIFAECDQFSGADPGVLFDIDHIIVYWSWFARTPEQIQDHLINGRYSVKLNEQALPDPVVTRRQIEGDPNYWVFYTVNLGNNWQTGNYGIEFKLSWVNPISDGYESFGPGTENERFNSSCTFSIKKNPYDITIVPENPKIPLQRFN